MRIARVITILMLLVCSLNTQAQKDSILADDVPTNNWHKNQLFVQGGITFRFSKYSVLSFHQQAPLIQLGYRKHLSKSISLNVGLKNDAYYTFSHSFIVNYEVELNDSIVIRQYPYHSTQRYNSLALQVGLNDEINRFFSIDGNILLGYGNEPEWVQFTGHNLNWIIYDHTYCNSCLADYLDQDLDPDTYYHNFRVGTRHSFLVGLSGRANFKVPIGQRFEWNLSYGFEVYFNRTITTTIYDEFPELDFWPESVFRGSQYFLSGFGYRF